MIKKIILNTLLYLAIIFGAILLYAPGRDSARNAPGSKVKFVYQQF